jgi:hypothetical protein
MIGLNGTTLPTPLGKLPLVEQLGTQAGIRIGELTLFDPALGVRLVIFLFVVWALPNAYQWLRDYPTALGLQAQPSWIERFTTAGRWRPTFGSGLAIGAVSAFTLLYAFSRAPSEFLYFQF